MEYFAHVEIIWRGTEVVPFSIGIIDNEGNEFQELSSEYRYVDLPKKFKVETLPNYFQHYVTEQNFELLTLNNFQITHGITRPRMLLELDNYFGKEEFIKLWSMAPGPTFTGLTSLRLERNMKVEPLDFKLNSSGIDEDWIKNSVDSLPENPIALDYAKYYRDIYNTLTKELYEKG